jgi:hypothetical protein
MLQKNLKYILLAVVAGVWGIIIYRILSGINTNGSESVLPVRLILKMKDTGFYEPYNLVANYEDPFGVEEDSLNLEKYTDSLIKSTNKFLQNSSMSDGLNKLDTNPDISFIKYKGLIINPMSHKKAAIISINGKEIFVSPKSKIDNVEIRSIQKNKIQIVYLSKKYWINRE